MTTDTATPPPAEFDEGRDAYWAGMDRDENAYKPGTPAHALWDRGWQHSLDSDEDANR